MPHLTIEQFFSQTPPPTLHHYTSAGALQGIVSSRSLWATHIRFLNDAREFVHASDLVREYVSSIESDPQPASLLWHINSMLRPDFGNVFIVSMSETGDLLSQWRGYCPAGGYSLEFNSAAVAAAAARERFVFVRCEYERSAQEHLVKQLVDEARTAFATHALPPGYQGGGDALEGHFVSTWFFPRMQRLGAAMKDPAFSEEREWRLIGGTYKPAPEMRVRVQGSNFVPYEVFPFGGPEGMTELLSGICIGPTPTPELAEFGLDRVRQLGLIGPATPTRHSQVPYRTT